MILFIQESKTERVLFHTNGAFAVPAVGENLNIEGKWYKVLKRDFWFKKLQNLYDNSVTLWVEEI